MLRLAVTRLEEIGYRVLEANNGVLALQILSSGTPIDLVFTDLIMPCGVSGLELARQSARDQSGRQGAAHDRIFGRADQCRGCARGAFSGVAQAVSVGRAGKGDPRGHRELTQQRTVAVRRLCRIKSMPL